MNYILLAIPGFLLLIAAEFLWDKYRDTGYYRFNDALNSLAMGMLSRVTQILYALIPFSIYAATYERWALFTWENTAIALVLAFVLYDLAYYWVHRVGHVMNISWASHVIHHSSEEYNLTTALRQTSVPNVIGWVFYIPLALLGFPPWILLTVASFNLLYQFWVHTQVIRRMPEWYEALFVTPSNHRVHHAKNKCYVDKNYGGVFILWDRIFGTFQPELDEEKVVFGISTQLASWNPIWGNLHILFQQFKDAWHTHSIVDKLTLWFRRTGYRPQDVEQRFPITKSNEAGDKYDVSLPSAVKGYLILQLTLLIGGVSGFMYLGPGLNSGDIALIGTTLAFALLSQGFVQEQKSYAWFTETSKLALQAVCCFQYIEDPLLLNVSLLALLGSFVFVIYRAFDTLFNTQPQNQ